MAQTDVSSTTSTTTPAALARQLFGYLNARDLDGVAKHWHDDLLEDFIVLGPLHGVAAVRSFFEELFAAFPDFHIEIETLLGDDTTAFIAWRAKGAFTGSPFQGIDANGATIELRGVDRMEFANDKLVRNTVYYDGAGFMRSVGLLPAQSSGAENAMKLAFNAVTRVKKRIGA
jgi:steroid delta-isomerase-like uncharacterized protein